MLAILKRFTVSVEGLLDCTADSRGGAWWILIDVIHSIYISRFCKRDRCTFEAF
jgi:hypothetical protein